MISLGLLVCYLVQKKERFYLYAATFSFIFWDITYFTVRLQYPNLYFLLPIGYIFYLTYKDNVEENLVFCLAGSMIGINLALSSVSQMAGYSFNGLEFTIFQLLLGIAVYSAGIVSRNRGYLFSVIYKIFGYIVTFICVYLLAFKVVLEEWSGAVNNAYLFGSLILAGLIVLLVVDERKSANFKNKPDRIELVGLIAALAGSLILLISPLTVLLNTIMMNSVLVVFATCLCDI